MRTMRRRRPGRSRLSYSTTTEKSMTTIRVPSSDPSASHRRFQRPRQLLKE
jgi:hypothetical protein